MNLADDKASVRRDLLLLAVVFGALFFFVLGRAPLANPDEGRYAEIPREMVVTGDWATPRLNGVAYFEKPPLVYWLAAIALTILGPSEWAMRATPALFALAGVLLAYATVRRLSGRSAGVGAAVTLGTSLFYFAIGRLLLLDMAVTVLMTATLFCFILGVREPPGTRRRWLFYGLYASAAFATLAKGLIGFLLPGAVMFLWLLLCDQWKRLRPFYLPTGMLLFLLVAGPWHVLAAHRSPTWAHFYFVHEHWERFTTTAHGRFQPWWFFLPLVIFGLFPWTGFLPAAMRDVLSGGWARRKENADAWFFGIWAVFIFLFFSASKSKLPPYVLPVFPPLAVLIGTGIARCRAIEEQGGWRGGVFSFSVGCAILAAGLVFAVARPAVVHLDATQVPVVRPIAFIMAATLGLGGFAACWLGLAGRLQRALVVMLATTIAFHGTFAFSAGKIQSSGTREIALFVKKSVPLGTPIYHYHDFFHDFTFYSGRFVGTVEFHGDELELINDEAARRSGRFLDEAEFRRRWLGWERVLVLVRKKKLIETRNDFAHALATWKRKAGAPGAGAAANVQRPAPPVLIDRTCRTVVVRESNDFLLLSNRGE